MKTGSTLFSGICCPRALINFLVDCSSFQCEMRIFTQAKRRLIILLVFILFMRGSPRVRRQDARFKDVQHTEKPSRVVDWLSFLEAAGSFEEKNAGSPSIEGVQGVHSVDTSKKPLRPSRDGCEFARDFPDMYEESSVEKLLRAFQLEGGAESNRRKNFMKDLFQSLNNHSAHYWLEEGTLIQMIRNFTGMPNEPGFLPFDDIDIGVLGVDLSTEGPLARALVDLKGKDFRIIRCDRQILSLGRGREYVDVMIFSSTSRCDVQEPNSILDCANGIKPFVLHTHKQRWDFLDGEQVALPGRTLLETVDYLEALFGEAWHLHDVENWRQTGDANKPRIGMSANWSRANDRLTHKPERFVLDPEGEVTNAQYTFQTVLADGRRLLRIDDYPYPDSTPISQQREWLTQAISALERRRIPYLLGVSPLRLTHDGDVQDHVNFLNGLVKHGFVCMHGFSHRTNRFNDEIDPAVWHSGGEFAKYHEETELEAEWQKGDAILKLVHRYTHEHFIPPFNALTQMMVNVLERNGVRFIHSFDAALCEPPLRAITHPPTGGSFGGCLENMRVGKSTVFVVSEWQRTYANADEVECDQHVSQITLHWYFDASRQTFPQSYEGICKDMQWGSDENVMTATS